MAAAMTAGRMGVAARVGRRAILFLPTLFGLLLLTFLIGRVIPVDPVVAVLGENATPDAYAAMRAQLGLDQPVLAQFGIYLSDLVRGDLGNALLTGRPVISDIAKVFPATLELATAAIVLGVGIGVPLGVLGAARRGSWVDHVVRVVGLLGHSVPSFWLGISGLLIFYAMLGWIGGSGQMDVGFEGEVEPVTGMLVIDALMAQDWEVFRDALNHLVLPASILGYGAVAYISRMTRSFLVEQLGQEYVVTARVKGLSRPRTIWRHAFLNIRVPLITVIALSYGGLMEGAVLTENVFGWPGFGQYFTSALLNGDMNAVLACTLVVGLIFMLLTLLTDVLYRVLDPRITA
jgi:peptide/nickel transport system permease protein